MTQDWERRVLREKKELDTKIRKLTDFIQPTNSVWEHLNEVDKGLLAAQLKAMQDYADILRQRIERFPT
jgi:hypothetical protein